MKAQGQHYSALMCWPEEVGAIPGPIFTAEETEAKTEKVPNSPGMGLHENVVPFPPHT